MSDIRESDPDGDFVEQVAPRSSEIGESDHDGGWGSENSNSHTLSPPVSGLSNDNEMLSTSGSEGIDEGIGKLYLVDKELEIDRLGGSPGPNLDS